MIDPDRDLSRLPHRTWSHSMRPPSRRSVVARVAAAVAASSLIAVALISSPAGAHEGTAVITVDSQTVEGTSVDYVVRAVWDNDGHAAADATATVVAESPTGERLGPVPMEPTDDDGRYAATLDFPGPGDWNVRFTVVTPPGTLEITQTVPPTDEPVASTEPAADPEPGSTSSVAATEDTTTSAAPLDAEPTSASADEGRPTSSASAALFFFILAAIILGACTIAYRSRGTRRAQQAARTASASARNGSGNDTTNDAESAPSSSAGDGGANTPATGDAEADTGDGTTD
jgi:hypothetical protein